MTAAAPAMDAPSRAEARLQPAVGLHDPVHPDRGRRDRDVDHPGRPYDYNADGTPIPGTYHAVDQNPQRIIVDSLTAPINGMYGIEGDDGIDLVLQQRRPVRRHRRRAVHPGHRRLPGRDHADRRDPGGHRAGRAAAARPRAADDPDPDGLFALGGTTYGMAEESLAFYVLIITVMIAAGYDALTGCGDPAARLRHRRARLDHQPLRDRHRSGLRRGRHQRGPDRPAS